MKTTILALAAVATLGMAVPAFATDNAPRGTVSSQAQDFSSGHRHHWRRHHWRRHHWHHQCFKVWRYGRLVTVCR